MSSPEQIKTALEYRNTLKSLLREGTKSKDLRSYLRDPRNREEHAKMRTIYLAERKTVHAVQREIGEYPEEQYGQIGTNNKDNSKAEVSSEIVAPLTLSDVVPRIPQSAKDTIFSPVATPKEKQEVNEELAQFTIFATKVRDGGVALATHEQFFAAQKARDPESLRSLVKDQLRILGAMLVTTPEPLPEAKVGQYLNQLGTLTGYSDRSMQREVLRDALDGLPDTERSIVISGISIAQKDELHYPDIDTCNEKTMASYIRSLAYHQHAYERDHDVVIEPTNQMRERIETVLDACLDRSDSSTGYPLNSAAIIEDLNSLSHSEDMWKRIIIAAQDVDNLDKLSSFFAQHPDTIPLAWLCENLPWHSTMSTLKKRSLSVLAFELGYRRATNFDRRQENY